MTHRPHTLSPEVEGGVPVQILNLLNAHLFFDWVHLFMASARPDTLTGVSPLI